MTTIQNISNITFGAIPLAKYKIPTGEQVRVFEVEKSDLSFIRDFSENLTSYMDKRKIETVTDKRLIIDTSFKIIKEMLERLSHFAQQKKKTHMLVAECDSDICGVLISGLPKKTPDGTTRFSCREGIDNSETELNWLATWNSSPDTERKGIGKILMGEFINTLEIDGFKKVFIQSEIPSLSFAQKFYEKLGFKAIDKQKPHSLVEKNKDVVSCIEDLYDYDIVPMLGKAKDINKVKEEIFSRFERTTTENNSVNLSDT